VKVGRIWLGVLLLPFALLAADAPPPPLEDFNIPLWNWSAMVRGAGGYKDNVMLSHTNAQGGSFWMSSAEIMCFRLPTDGWLFNAFADFTDTRFFDVPSVSSEQVAVSGLQLTKDFSNGWKSTLGLTALYQNQVMDYSDAYTNQNSVGQIIGSTLSPRWSVRRTFEAVWIEGEISGTRQWFDAPLDSYWQFGPQLAVGHGWGRGSEASLSYRFSRLDYDSREQVNLSGAAITNSSLAMDIHDVELSLTHYWDQKKHWQTITTAGLEANFDNGSGYYDYDNWYFSQRLRYRADKWEATVQSRVSYFDYLHQTVSDTDSDARRRTAVNLVARVERKLTKHFMVYVSYIWDRSFSNLDFDDYQANTFMGGLAVMFE